MRPSTFWTMAALLGLWGCAPGASARQTICDATECKCDAFQKVSCACTEPHQVVTLSSAGPYKMLDVATSVEVHNCSRLQVQPGAFLNLHQLKSVQFHSIGSISLLENSLSWDSASNYKPGMENGIRILIYNSSVEELGSYAIKGSIFEIVIDSSTVNDVKSFSVSNIKDMDNIRLMNSTFNQVKTQAFKKFNLNVLHVKNCNFRELPSRMFSDLTVNDEFVFDSNEVERIRSSFCIIYGPKSVKIENCKFGVIDGESFKIVAAGPVRFKNNTIEELKTKSLIGIGVVKEVTTRLGFLDFDFKKNNVSKIEPGALDINVTSFRLMSKDLVIKESCDCLQWYFQMDPTVMETTFCNSGKSIITGQYVSIEDYKRVNCVEKKISSTILSIIVVSAIVLLGLFIVAVILITKHLRKNRANLEINKNMIKPDGRTYKETELFVVVEKAELLTTDL